MVQVVLRESPSTIRAVRNDGVISAKHIWRLIMGSTADDYRANAMRCERMAQQEGDALLTRQYLEMARQWRAMAGQTAETEKAGVP
jgi:hypothetical protein